MAQNKANEQFEVKRVCDCWLNEKGDMPWCYCEGQPELE